MSDLGERVRTFQTKVLGELFNKINEHTLSKSQLKILEYFVDKSRGKVRKEIPVSVVYYFEIPADTPEQMLALVHSNVDILIQELTEIRYVERKIIAPVLTTGHGLEIRGREDDYLKLTDRGFEFLVGRHPPLLLWWTKLLDQMPSLVSLSVTIIGLIASVFGIIAFVAGKQWHSVP